MRETLTLAVLVVVGGSGGDVDGVLVAHGRSPVSCIAGGRRVASVLRWYELRCGSVIAVSRYEGLDCGDRIIVTDTAAVSSPPKPTRQYHDRLHQTIGHQDTDE